MSLPLKSDQVQAYIVLHLNASNDCFFSPGIFYLKYIELVLWAVAVTVLPPHRRSRVMKAVNQIQFDCLVTVITAPPSSDAAADY